MASHQHHILFVLLLSFSSHIFIPRCNSQPSNQRPKAMLIPVSKDQTTLQPIAHLSIGTPLKPTGFVLDIGGKNLWMVCDVGYNSSTYRPARCGSAECSVAQANNFPDACYNCFWDKPPGPGCNKKYCSLPTVNTVMNMTEISLEVALDSLLVGTTDGSKAGKSFEFQDFIFSCANTWLLPGLALSAKGMAGLGRSPTSLWSLFSNRFGGSLQRKFALCLPTTSKAPGTLFSGQGPYLFYTNSNRSMLADVASIFRYTTTKLLINPVSKIDYYIKVQSISIQMNITVPLNSTLLSIDSRGRGGTKLSTTTPYTVMETSIYQAFTKSFDDEIGTAIKVPPVAPFTKCYKTDGFLRIPGLGLSAPWVSFVLDEAKDSYWILYGANTMVELANNVTCLAFVDGGPDADAGIVIGTHQMQDHLIELDLAASKVGISSHLSWHNSQCSNFNF